VFLANIAIGSIALVQHDSVLATLAAAILDLADTFGVVVIVGRLLPKLLGVPDETI
jgi:hypothetical protein